MPKDRRPIFELECEICKKRNYVTERNPQNTKEKLAIKKYCPKCKKRTVHREKKIVYKKD
jgi:large subunit ribosomal protein L33